MSVVIRLYDQSFYCLGYLMSYDPDKGDDKVTGDVVSTPNISEAMKFDKISSAISYAMQQSTRVPLREDGKPNRPLMAFTMEFEAGVD